MIYNIQSRKCNNESCQTYHRHGFYYSPHSWSARLRCSQRRETRFMRIAASKAETEVKKRDQVARYQNDMSLISRHTLDLILIFICFLFKADKRQFFVGSRYGRSQSDLTNMDENGKTSANRIVPRNDRFFFGSRYGKRSPPVAAIDSDHNDMTCFYTGVTNLFRCVESQ